MNKKKIVILGGGTNTYISNHLALSAPAYGTTAKNLYYKFINCADSNKYEINLYLSKMANSSIRLTEENLRDCNQEIKELSSNVVKNQKLLVNRKEYQKRLQDTLAATPSFDTPEEVEALVDTLIADPDVRVIVFNVAMVDYKPVYLEEQIDQGSSRIIASEFGKYAGRLSTSEHPDLVLDMTVQEKIINKIRKTRKDIFLVGFKTTCGATKEEQFHKGLKLCKDASANIVFANDVDKDRIDLLNNSLHLLEERMQSKDPVKHRRQGLIKSAQCSVDSLRNNALITPEESSYWYNTRDEALDALVEMTLSRIKGEFTRTTVVDGELTHLYATRHRLPGQIYTVRSHNPREVRYANFEYNFNVSPAFGEVLTWLISQGAYKKNVMGKTPGHFGIKLDETTSLCSIRKQDYTDLRNLKLVKVEQKQGQIIAHGAKPSVGDATQRELFKYYPEMDFIIHFHCPLKPKHNLSIPIVNQFEYECGSHGETSCSKNTRTGMKAFQLPSGSYLCAVHLDHHGPNIMFNKSVDIEELKTFIIENWDLSLSDNGLK